MFQGVRRRLRRRVAHLRDHGVPVVAEPADQPWGDRMAEVADPDGNRVIVAGRG